MRLSIYKNHLKSVSIIGSNSSHPLYFRCMQFTLAIHGGAGTIDPASMTPEKQLKYESGLMKALESGRKILEKGGSALDAVSLAVVELENCPMFNAGKGAVFNNQGQHELDASIMDGRNLAAGAVTCVQGIVNPVLLSRAVMEKSEHVLLSGAGAEIFAKSQGIEFADKDYFYDEFRWQQWQQIKGSDNFQLDHSVQTEKKFGTVGAVAMDNEGNLAAATSTGGMTNKKWGRIGDTPIIGAGTYANNNTCAVSCTGHGELFIRSVVAYDISCLMEYKGISLKAACEEVVLRKLVKIGGEGGLIAVDGHGNIELVFNSTGMYRAWASSEAESQVAIY